MSSTNAGKKPLHIGLLWHSFLSDNLGVGALTIANANLIAQAVEKHGCTPVFHVIGSRGGSEYSSEIAYPSDFTNVGYKALANPASDLHAAFRKCDIVFDIGGGDSFSDIYPWSRFWLIIGSKIIARQSKGPLVLSPQTIGPFFTRRARFAAVAALKAAKHIFARDETSRAKLDELGLGAKSSLTTDVAFALPFTKPQDKDSRDLSAGPIKVGLNVSALLYRRDLSRGDRIKMTMDYKEMIHSIIERMIANPRVTLHIVPHVLAANAPYEDDYAVGETLKELYPEIVLPPRFKGPSQAKSYVADMDLFMGSRMHSTVAALSSETAVVPLGYSRKFNGLFGSLGYDWNVDLTQDSADDVFGRIDQALADLPKVRADAIAANAEARRRLGNYEDYLDKTIAGLIGEHA